MRRGQGCAERRRGLIRERPKGGQGRPLPSPRRILDTFGKRKVSRKRLNVRYRGMCFQLLHVTVCARFPAMAGV